MFHSEFLKPLALGTMNKLPYNSLHCTYGWQEGFLIFSVEDGSFIIFAPIKILELQLLLDRQFPISSHIFLKFLFVNSFKQCYHNIREWWKKSFRVLQEKEQNQKTPRYERETAKHKEIHAIQHKVGNIAALNT